MPNHWKCPPRRKRRADFGPAIDRLKREARIAEAVADERAKDEAAIEALLGAAGYRQHYAYINGQRVAVDAINITVSPGEPPS